MIYTFIVNLGFQMAYIMVIHPSNIKAQDLAQDSGDFMVILL